MSSASRKLIQASGAVAGEAPDTGDDDFANVVLLLDGDGTSGDDNNTFTDSSTNAHTITENGSVVQGSFSPYGDNWSNYFDGAGNYLTYSDDLSLRLGTGDFTIEFWINQSSKSGYQTPLTKGYISSGDYIVQTGNGDGNMVFAASGTIVATESGSTVNVGEWYHIAVVRSGTTITIYRNGVSVATGTSSANLNTTSSLLIGQGSTYAVNGYLSNVRIVKGTALYTSAFTPSTSPFTAITNTVLLTCQSNRFKDSSIYSHTAALTGTPKVTPFSPFKNDDARDIATDGGSANFDSNEYLTIADNANLDVSGAMTAECWVYITDMPDENIGQTGQGYLINRWTASGNQRSWAFLYGNNGDVAFYSSSAGSTPYTISTATGALGRYRWTHVAASWDGTNQRLFIDGDLKVTTANASGPFSTASSGFTVNAINTSLTGTNSNQYIADARYFNDAAIYTSSFTPPTAPLSATSGSDTAAVLLNFQDSAIPDLSGLNNIDTVGNAKVGASDPTKYGSNAMEFGGTTDRLITIGPDLLLGTGDFTIEFWVYFNSVSDGNIYTILDGRTTSDGTNVMWAQETSGSWTIFNGAGSGLASGWGSGTFTTGVWYHLAQTRESGVSRFFKDGTQTSGDLSDTSDYNSSTYSIGGRFAVGGYSLDGYIDDFRITKGIARYTSNFTAPDAALSKF